MSGFAGRGRARAEKQMQSSEWWKQTESEETNVWCYKHRSLAGEDHPGVPSLHHTWNRRTIASNEETSFVSCYKALNPPCEWAVAKEGQISVHDVAILLRWTLHACLPTCIHACLLRHTEGPVPTTSLSVAGRVNPPNGCLNSLPSPSALTMVSGRPSPPSQPPQLCSGHRHYCLLYY